MIYDNKPPGVDRYGSWMQTFTGGVFWPMDPRAEEVHIADIAHALSLQCRYAGHCERFYSVAEHSVYVSHEVPAEHALTALLHDATEAYCVDVPRPIKGYLDNYEAIEWRLWRAVAARFGLPDEMPPVVKVADNAVLLAEAAQIVKPHPLPWAVEGTPADVVIECLPPWQAEAFFMRRFEELTLQRSLAI